MPASCMSDDKVRLDGADLGTDGPVFGTVELVYPQIQDGRVIADATVARRRPLLRRPAHPRLGCGRRPPGHRHPRRT